MARPRKARPAEPVRRLERFAAAYEVQRVRLDAERDKLKSRRDEEIRAAAKDLPEAEIARIFGLSQQYVNRLVRRKV